MAKKKSFLFSFFFRWSLIFGIWFTLILGGTVIWAFLNLPETESIQITRQPSITFLDRQGRILASFGDIYGQSIGFEQLPEDLVNAVIVTEDRRFFNHIGIDLKGIFRALVVNLKAGKIVQGGSTITQQLAKNLFLSPERSITRKLHEAILSLWLEFRFTKKQILSIYLNRVYLGSGTYGVQAASEKYFNKKVEELNLYECALIASLLKAPSRYNPISNKELSDIRTEKVLRNLVNFEFVEVDEIEKFKRITSSYKNVIEPPKSSRYFVDWLLPRVRSYLGEIEEDLIVRTTLDIELQRKAEESISKISKNFSSANQSAIVVLDLKGGVLAMVGGRDYGDTQFNRVTQAQRQPGSAFKLFVYLEALEKGFEPEDLVEDSKVEIDDWSPENYKKEFLGEISISDAFSKSINTVAVKISEEIGRESVIKKARSLGISSKILNTPSVALGTSEVNLLELTGAYNVVANGGKGVWTHGIRLIENKDGELLYQRKGFGPGKVLDSDIVKKMIYMLKHTIDSGTGRNAKIDRPTAGKTGTSQSLRDAWFIGFSSDMVAGVWFGNDNDSPMKKVTGGTAPAILWGDFMQKAHTNIPVKNLKYDLIQNESNGILIKKDLKKFEKEKPKKEFLFERILENMFKR